MGVLNELSVRDATRADAQICRSIYRPYVETLPVSFETHLPPVEQMAERIEAAHQRHAWMIIEWDGNPIGYAQAKAWDDRAAYQWSCETGI